MNALSGPAYIVTGVLLVAGVAKILRPAATATALRELKVPSPMIATRLLGLAEVMLSGAAITFGTQIFWAGIALAYGVFTVFILWALRGNGAIASCGCFGREDTPPTPGHAAFNAAAAAVAGLAVVDPVRISDFDGSALVGIVFVLSIGLGTVLAIAALTTLPRLLAVANGSAAPAVATFSVGGRP